jgi:LysM repeat protein
VALLSLAIVLASPQSGWSAQKGFYYTIQRRDSLVAVAGRFGLSSQELARENRLSPSAGLVAGSRLWIPRNRSRSKSTPVARPTSTSSSRFKAKTNPAHKASSSSRVNKSVAMHVVKRGDTLWGIGNRYGLTVDKLARINGINPKTPLEVGQKLQVMESKSPGTSVKDVPGGGVQMAEGKPTTQSTGKSNNIKVSSTSPKASKKGYIWPVDGPILRPFTDTTDEKHMGINIAVPKGTEVRAASDGEVVYADDKIPYYGQMVIVNHGNNLATCYSMNDRLMVRKGQKVRRGQVIARSGDNGRGGEGYLHFELRKDGDAIDPTPYLP